MIVFILRKFCSETKKTEKEYFWASSSYSLILLTSENFKWKQEPEEDQLNLHVMQYYQTVSSQIERMNGDFTLSAKN